MKSSTTVVRVGDTSGNNTMNNSMASVSMAGVSESQRSMAGLSESHGGTVVIHDGDSSDGEPDSRKSSNINSLVPIVEEEEAVEVIQSKADIDDRNDEIRRSQENARISEVNESREQTRVEDASAVRASGES